MQALLTRTPFEMHRVLEFFTERELQMQIGVPRYQWLAALTNELIDNGLDACETAGIAPEIAVSLDRATLTVCDNGPCLPETTIERSLDYLRRGHNSGRPQQGFDTNAHRLLPLVLIQQDDLVQQN